MISVDELVSLLGRHRYNFTNEGELQDGIAEVLAGQQVVFEREAVLSPEDRLDFLVGTIAIEVKIKGGISPLLRQLHRYAQHDRVGSILVVTSKVRLAILPDAFNGKPIHGLRIATRGGL